MVTRKQRAWSVPISRSGDYSFTASHKYCFRARERTTCHTAKRATSLLIIIVNTKKCELKLNLKLAIRNRVHAVELTLIWDRENVQWSGDWRRNDGRKAEMQLLVLDVFRAAADTRGPDFERNHVFCSDSSR
jgi:hypothetical protein